MNDLRPVASLSVIAKVQPFSGAARLRSFVFAARGLGTMLQSQHNAWIHLVATGTVLAAGWVCELARFEWLAVVVAIVSVWAAESLNTAFEFLCDVASPQYHPQVARAKDVAAAAVLICSLGAVVTAGLVFVPRVLQVWTLLCECG